MKTILHRSLTRGYAEHGWLNSFHTFSFAGYYDPERMQFGALRVLNDDRVAPGMGFGTHPHDNMEIISIPLSGDLMHRDSMGNTAVIREGDIQVMSAGSGIRHSEMNASAEKEVQFLQIWIFPNQRNVQPRYDQQTMNRVNMQNRLLQVLSPDASDEGVWIHQDAWFHMGEFEQGVATTYNLKKNGNGVYAFVLEGSFTIAGEELNRRDGMGLLETATINILSMQSQSKLLLMEVPV